MRAEVRGREEAGGRWHRTPQLWCPLQSPTRPASQSHSSRPQGRRASAGPRPGTSFPRGLASLRRHLWHRENSLPTVGNRHTSPFQRFGPEACRVGGAQGEGSSLSQVSMWVLRWREFQCGEAIRVFGGRERPSHCPPWAPLTGEVGVEPCRLEAVPARGSGGAVRGDCLAGRAPAVVEFLQRESPQMQTSCCLCVWV